MSNILGPQKSNLKHVDYGLVDIKVSEANLDIYNIVESSSQWIQALKSWVC